MREIYREKRNLKARILSVLAGAGSLLLSVGAGADLNAQVSLYSFAQTNGTFTPVTGGTVLGQATGNASATNLNSVVYNFTLPFTFSFNSQNYTDVHVSSNGFITFGTTAPLTSNTSAISASAAYDGAVSAFGRDIASFYDIAGRTGDIRWETVGTAPNREVVIQWTNFRPTNTTSTTSVYSFSFQIRLQETTNKVAVVYSAGSYLVGSTSYSAATNQVGLRGATNADFNNRYNPSSISYTNSVAGDANGDDQAFNTVNAVPGMPSDGLTYTWTPPSCFAPAITGTGTTGTNTAQIIWNAPGQVPAVGYELYYSTSGTAPGATTVLDGTNSVTAATGSTSASISGLTASTSYNVWIRSVCSATDKSIWTAAPLRFSTLCQPPVLTSVAVSPTPVCMGGTASLTAVADAGVTVNWYADATSTTPLATGSSFTTPVLTATTDYYESAKTGDSYFVGPVNPNSLTAGTATGAITTYYIQFEVTNTPVRLNSVDVFPGVAGQSSTLEILEGPTTFSVISTIPFTSTLASDGTTAQTVPLNVLLSPGTYRMRLSGGDYYRNYQSNAVFPYSVPNFSITTGSNIASNSYYFMYNLNVGDSCESPRTLVTAVYDAGCTMGTAESDFGKDLRVYPNPFSEVLHISDLRAVQSVTVSDLAGRVVKTIEKPTAQLNLSMLSTGMYIIQLKYRDGSARSVKVVKK